jgi:hypothetical protein
MKRFITTLVLALALSGSVLAGDMPTSGSPAPAPGGPTASTQASDVPVPGDVPSVGKAELSSEALSVLLSVLSFLAA